VSRFATDRTGFPETTPLRTSRAADHVVMIAAMLLAAVAASSWALRWRHGALFLVAERSGSSSTTPRSLHRGVPRLVSIGDTRGLRAQMLMLAVATVLFAPMLSAARCWAPTSRARRPASVRSFSAPRSSRSHAARRRLRLRLPS